MKITITIILLTLVTIVCGAQNASTIVTSTAHPMAGKEVTYIYSPQKHLSLPDSLMAYVMCVTPKYSMAVVPLVKHGNSYTFTYTAQDSAPLVAMCIGSAANNAVVDNNNGKMFTQPLYNSEGRLPANMMAETAYLLSDYARYVFKLNLPGRYLTAMFTQAFKQHPEQKDKYYIYYLFAMVYDYEKDTTWPLIKAYTKKLLAKNNDEKTLNSAYRLCKLAKMSDEVALLEQRINTDFPASQAAKDIFMDNLGKQDKNAATLITAMHDYFARFGDSSQEVKNNFYYMIVAAGSEDNDWPAVDTYEALITNRRSAAMQLNSLAARLASEGNNLPYAASLAQRAMQVPNATLKNGRLTGTEKEALQRTYDNYAGTYALILYKQGYVDSAYYYENAIGKNNITDAGREVLAGCIEKLQGPEAARNYIEEQLKEGSTSSAPLLQQLQSIYARLHLPQADYDKITMTGSAATKAKTKQAIEHILGTTHANNFTLKDLAGNTVSLASLRNKVVVLDFWATWCGPCLASFPAMQQAVIKFKDDKDVAFLFIAVWEKGDNATIRKNINRVIADNNYSFHVLVDYESKIPPNYKLRNIPTKFIIDKQGNVVFMLVGNYSNDIVGAIEEARKR